MKFKMEMLAISGMLVGEIVGQQWAVVTSYPAKSEWQVMTTTSYVLIKWALALLEPLRRKKQDSWG